MFKEISTMKRSFMVLALAGGSLSLPASAEMDTAYYNDHYCTTCHGADGIGSEGVQAPRLAGMEPWYLKRQLEHFRAGMRGMHREDFQGTEMQPMAAKLSDESIAELVAWVGSWEYVPTPVTLEGDAEAGRALYASCSSCHGANGEGSPTLGAPALAGQNDWYLVTQLQNFKAGYRGSAPGDTYGAQMIPMAASLADDTAIRNVVSYINTLGR